MSEALKSTTYAVDKFWKPSDKPTASPEACVNPMFAEMHKDARVGRRWGSVATRLVIPKGSVGTEVWRVSLFSIL
jgi:hypothetical protein